MNQIEEIEMTSEVMKKKETQNMNRRSRRK
jgi:hypothetical protein